MFMSSKKRAGSRARKEKASLLARCRCGSYRFQVEGLVGYRQDFDGLTHHWASSQIAWDLDYPQQVGCANCGRDASTLLKGLGELGELYADPLALPRELEGARLYLVDFELISGEYGQPFFHVFQARNERHLERRINSYLHDYYESGAEEHDRTWTYCEGDVSVKLHGWKEIKDLGEVIRKLMI